MLRRKFTKTIVCSSPMQKQKPRVRLGKELAQIFVPVL